MPGVRLHREVIMQSDHASSIAASSSPAFPSSNEPDRRERLRRFGEAIDAIRDRVEAQVGPADVAYIRRVNAFSRTMEVIGRVLLHVSFEPVTFTLGVGALWLHKQLQATEVGHTALHGAYDRLPGAEGFRSETFKWDVPIDEESWRHGHNVKHHQYTNVAGRDPDIHFGPARLTEHTPHSPVQRFQHLFMVGVLAPNFAFLMNWHFTGLNDVYFGNGRPEEFDVLRDRSPASVREAHRKALRKYAPYYLKNYVFFPLLAGPMFWKVLLGNWLAETLRDLYSAATIYCGHVGDDVAAYPEGTRARGRGEWYAMQVEATNDFEVSLPVSMLCGGLDRQIEHHLFPRLPPNRLREIAPQVRAACEAHGVRYRTDSWGRTLKKALGHVRALSVAGARDTLRAMA
jgi:NADPH-dependent stearoyl-CoA 9-desaturase